MVGHGHVLKFTPRYLFLQVTALLHILVNETEFASLDIEMEGFEMSVKRSTSGLASSAPVVAAAPVAAGRSHHSS